MAVTLWIKTPTQPPEGATYDRIAATVYFKSKPLLCNNNFDANGYADTEMQTESTQDCSLINQGELYAANASKL